MSKQQGQSPEPEVASRGKSGKKQHGIYELWMRYNPEVAKERMEQGLRLYTPPTNWHKIRSYKTKDIAEKNKEDSIRKWNSHRKDTDLDVWQFEVREKT